MGVSGLDSLHGQYSWEHYVVIISGVVIITLIISCTDCWKSQPEAATEATETEEDEKEGKKTKKKLGRKLAKKKILAGKSKPVRSASLPTITEQPPTSYITLPQVTASSQQSGVQPENEDASRVSLLKTLSTKTLDRFRAFQRTEIQPQREDIISESSLTRTRSAPVLSKKPETDTGCDDDVGTISFTISYNAYEKVLKVKIQNAVNLAAKDLSGFSDPYVKVLLHPDKKLKLETKVKRRDLNPVWNEVLTFEGFSTDMLLKRVLYLQVLDYDKFSRPDPIGDTEVVLGEDAGLQLEPEQFVRKLRPHKKMRRNILGDILISLSYDQTLGRLSVTIMKCRNLKPMDVTGKCDPYVKVYTLYSGRRVDKKKTEIKKRQLNPVWNESMEFDVSIQNSRSVMLVFTVMDFDAVMRNKPIGEIRIGYRTTGPMQHHWTEMLCNPNKPIAMWHTLVKAEKHSD